MARKPTPAKNPDTEALSSDNKLETDSENSQAASGEFLEDKERDELEEETKTAEVRILRDQGDYRCGTVVSLPVDQVEIAVKSGWGDPEEAAVAQGYAEAE